jgi:hypothetical protein
MLLSLSVRANNIQVSVMDTNQQPIYQAMVIARPVALDIPMLNINPKLVLVDQIDKEFVNKNTIIHVGDSVNFPNKDNIRHHVYSFSAAKKFELPLYEGIPANSIVFDQPGVIKIGCNIHDWMIGYIYVSDSKYTSKTDQQGNALLHDLPVGEYDVSIWHNQMARSESSTTQRIIVEDNQNIAPLIWEIAVKVDFRPRRAPMAMGRSY